MRAWIVTLCACAAWSTANAAPRLVLRFAHVAPADSSWDREVKAFAREVELQTQGDVHVKVYPGGIAGDDLEIAARIERGQLDGAVSPGPLCARVVPIMRITRVAGIFQRREEAAYVMNALEREMEAQALKAGLVLLGTGGMGSDLLFLRELPKSIEELRRVRMWRWNLDEVGVQMGRAMGFRVIELPLNEVGRAFDDGRLDGAFAIPSAALGMQWYTRVRYMLDLRTSFLTGCALMASRTFDRLSIEHQRVVRAAVAKLNQRVEAVGRHQDEQLLGGLFEKQGLRPVTPSPELSAAFFAAARAARERLGSAVVEPALLARVQQLLADYRAEHPGR